MEALIAEYETAGQSPYKETLAQTLSALENARAVIDARQGRIAQLERELADAEAKAKIQSLRAALEVQSRSQETARAAQLERELADAEERGQKVLERLSRAEEEGNSEVRVGW